MATWLLCILILGTCRQDISLAYNTQALPLDYGLAPHPSPVEGREHTAISWAIWVM